MFSLQSFGNFTDALLFFPRLFEKKRGDIDSAFRPPSSSLLLQFYTDFFESLQEFRSWTEDVRIIWI